MDVVYPACLQKLYITIVFKLSHILKSSKEKLKTMFMPIFFRGEGRGVNKLYYGKCGNDK